MIFPALIKHCPNNKVRYYRVSIEATLFNEFVVMREYGNVGNKTPTGIKQCYFPTLQEATKCAEKIIKEKVRKNYY